MRFLTPLGLLGLIGILLLILIYVLKPKYQEKSISSTFIWKLSLKYKKKKIPFQWLRSSLLVILQFAILGLITLSLTTPLFALNTTSGEKIVILDASANMQAESGGRTRFERAVQEIGSLADSTTPEDRFTVILAADEASFVARRLDSSKFIKQLLSELECTYANANIDDAMSLTEGVLAENPYAEVILFTGNQYEDVGSVQLRDMSRDEWNVSILDFSAELVDGYYEFTTKISSFNQDEDIAVILDIDGERRDAKVIQANNNEIITITWESLYVLDYSSAKVYVEYDDDFQYDNQFVIHGWENELFSVQLVSESPRFLQAAFLTMGNYQIDIPVAPDAESPVPIAYEGYDLYVFDGVVPDYMPVDGSVWLINQPDGTNSIGLTVGPELTGDFIMSSTIDLPDKEQSILDYLRPDGITVSAYNFVSDNDDFETVLTIDNDPAILVKDEDGQKIVVFTFSLHNSNLPIIPDFITMIYNLSEYSVQNMVDEYLYYPGDTININKKPSAMTMALAFNGEEVTYENIPDQVIAEEPGAYTLTQYLASGEEASVDFYVRVAETQSNFDYDYGNLSNPIIPETSETVDVNQDTYDIIYYMVGIMILLLLIEWGLHYNERN